MRTLPASSGAKSSSWPPSVLVNCSDMGRASSPMQRNEGCGADCPARAFVAAEVAGGRIDGHRIPTDREQAGHVCSHLVQALAAELWAGTDYRYLHRFNRPAGPLSGTDGLT